MDRGDKVAFICALAVACWGLVMLGAAIGVMAMRWLAAVSSQ